MAGSRGGQGRLLGRGAGASQLHVCVQQRIALALDRPVCGAPCRAVEGLCTTYVCLFVSSHTTQAGAVQEWLRRVANDATRGDATAYGCGAADWAALVSQVFPDDETVNAYQHLRLADFTDNVAALPPEARMQAMQGAFCGCVQSALISHDRGWAGGPWCGRGAGGAGAAAPGQPGAAGEGGADRRAAAGDQPVVCVFAVAPAVGWGGAGRAGRAGRGPVVDVRRTREAPGDVSMFSTSIVVVHDTHMHAILHYSSYTDH